MKKNKNSELKTKEVTHSFKAKNKTKAIQPKNKENSADKSDKLDKNKVDEVIAKDLVKVVKAGEAKNSAKEKGKKKNINKVNAAKPNIVEEVVAAKGKETNGEPTEKQLAKIAKKKAQKLKKQQKKAEDLKAIESANDKGTQRSDVSKDEKPIQNQNLTPTKKETAVSTETNSPTTKNPKKQRKIEKKKLLKNLKDDEEEPQQRARINFDLATVFVGNLPVNTKRIQLVRLFEKYGPISAIRLRSACGKVLMKHKQRRKAGSLNAYVVMNDEATADKALELNGTEFKSNHIRVTRASKNAHNAENADAKNMIFVGNLKYSATEEKLREIFSSCGEIEYVRCLHGGEKGCNGVAYVCFKAPDAVGLALELNETILDERPIHVERYSAKKLGAKEARDKMASQGTKKVTGAKKRLDDKKKKQNDKNPVKSDEFRGVKVDGLKKKQKKKKSSGQLKKMAKKIAPRTK